MHGRNGETQGRLGDHPRFPGKPDGVLQVARIVQPVERPGNIGTLLLFYLEHQPAYIGRYRCHPNPV